MCCQKQRPEFQKGRSHYPAQTTGHELAVWRGARRRRCLSGEPCASGGAFAAAAMQGAVRLPDGTERGGGLSAIQEGLNHSCVPSRRSELGRGAAGRMHWHFSHRLRRDERASEANYGDQWIGVCAFKCYIWYTRI